MAFRNYCRGDFYSKTNNYLGGLFVKLPYICWQLSSNFRLENTVEKAPQPRFAQKACTPKVQLVSTVWPPGVSELLWQIATGSPQHLGPYHICR